MAGQGRSFCNQSSIVDGPIRLLLSVNCCGLVSPMEFIQSDPRDRMYWKVQNPMNLSRRERPPCLRVAPGTVMAYPPPRLLRGVPDLCRPTHPPPPPATLTIARSPPGACSPHCPRPTKAGCSGQRSQEGHASQGRGNNVNWGWEGGWGYADTSPPPPPCLAAPPRSPSLRRAPPCPDAPGSPAPFSVSGRGEGGAESGDDFGPQHAARRGGLGRCGGGGLGGAAHPTQRPAAASAAAALPRWGCCRTPPAGQPIQNLCWEGGGGSHDYSCPGWLPLWAPAGTARLRWLGGAVGQGGQVAWWRTARGPCLVAGAASSSCPLPLPPSLLTPRRNTARPLL